jgi:hypothetical protein
MVLVVPAWFLAYMRASTMVSQPVTQTETCLLVQVGCGNSNLQEGMVQSGYHVVNVSVHNAAMRYYLETSFIGVPFHRSTGFIDNVCLFGFPGHVHARPCTCQLQPSSPPCLTSMHLPLPSMHAA